MGLERSVKRLKSKIENLQTIYSNEITIQVLPFNQSPLITFPYSYIDNHRSEKLQTSSGLPQRILLRLQQLYQTQRH